MISFFTLLLLLILFDRSVSITLAITAVVWLVWGSRGEYLWLKVFVIGLFHSWLMLLPLGLVSGFLLSAALLLTLFKQALGDERWWAVALSGVVLEALYELLWRGGILWNMVLLHAIVLTASWTVYRFLEKGEGVYLKK